MTKHKTDFDYLQRQKEKAEQKLRYYQHQEKMLEHRIPELTRKARTHRLCTRGGMLESFLICPGELTDDQVCAGPGKDDSRFARSPERSNPIVIGRNYTPFRCNCGLADGLMKPGWQFRSPPRFHPKENCIFLALLRSYPFAALAQGRSAPLVCRYLCQKEIFMFISDPNR